MARRLILVLAADVVLALGAAWVVQDLQWRAAYAASPHAMVSGYEATFLRSVLTQVFSMTGSGFVLTSPPALDWLQVIGVLFVLANGWLVYGALRRKKQPASQSPQL
jgi:protein-S-isoprenylcysteine O-methyltransferase Ste14